MAPDQDRSAVAERIAQQLRPYMSDEDAEKATEAVLRVLEEDR